MDQCGDVWSERWEIVWVYWPQHAGDIPKFEPMQQAIKKDNRDSRL